MQGIWKRGPHSARQRRGGTSKPSRKGELGEVCVRRAIVWLLGLNGGRMGIVSDKAWFIRLNLMEFSECGS